MSSLKNIFAIFFITHELLYPLHADKIFQIDLMLFYYLHKKKHKASTICIYSATVFNLKKFN